MSGIIGKKIGMTSVYDDSGKNIPCTVIEAGPCVITQIKTSVTDGYNALQLAFDDQKESRVNKPKMGHFNKANTNPKRKLVEFRGFEGEYNLGDSISVDIFAISEFEWSIFFIFEMPFTNETVNEEELPTPLLAGKSPIWVSSIPSEILKYFKTSRTLGWLISVTLLHSSIFE